MEKRKEESILFFSKNKKKFFFKIGLSTLQNIKFEPRIKSYFFRLHVLQCNKIKVKIYPEIFNPNIFLGPVHNFYY